NAPAALTGHPSSARNKPGTPSRQKRQNHPRSALPEAGRKTHVPVSVASPPRSRSDRLADRAHAPSPFRKFRAAPTDPHGINQTRLRQRAVRRKRRSECLTGEAIRLCSALQADLRLSAGRQERLLSGKIK